MSRCTWMIYSKGHTKKIMMIAIIAIVIDLYKYMLVGTYYNTY